MPTILVFGVFDSFHEGHKNFLTQALERKGNLIVVVTPSETVQLLKGRAPKQTLEERILALKAFNGSLKIIAGDTVPGTWNVLKAHKPDLVLLGYDQHGIAKELTRLNIAFEFLEAHYPEKYKSSLMK